MYYIVSIVILFTSANKFFIREAGSEAEAEQKISYEKEGCFPAERNMGVPKPQSSIGTKKRAPSLSLTYMGIRRVCAVKSKVCVLSVKKHQADESSKLYEKRATPVSVTYLGVRRVCAIKNKARKDGVAERMFAGSGEPNDSRSNASSGGSCASSVGSCSGGNGNTWFKLPFCSEEDAESLCSDAESFCGCGNEEEGGFVSGEEGLWGAPVHRLEIHF